MHWCVLYNFEAIVRNLYIEITEAIFSIIHTSTPKFVMPQGFKNRYYTSMHILYILNPQYVVYIMKASIYITYVKTLMHILPYTP
jgi:hypothetical protein